MNKQQWKEKILRNLDKISYDQIGHFANANLLKNLDNENNIAEKQKAGVYQIKIDDEEINLLEFERLENEEDYLEIRNAIVNDIKKNISDWEIKKDRENEDILQNRKNGAKVWLIIFSEVLFKNGERDWVEIKEALENSQTIQESQKRTETKNNENNKTFWIIFIIAGTVIFLSLLYWWWKRKSKNQKK